jgi:hypothetical protein
MSGQPWDRITVTREFDGEEWTADYWPHELAAMRRFAEEGTTPAELRVLHALKAGLDATIDVHGRKSTYAGEAGQWDEGRNTSGTRVTHTYEQLMRDRATGAAPVYQPSPAAPAHDQGQLPIQGGEGAT